MHGETCYCRGAFSLERCRKRRRGPVVWSCPHRLGRGWGRVGFPVPRGTSLGLGKKLYWRSSSETVPSLSVPSPSAGNRAGLLALLTGVPCATGEAAEVVQLLRLPVLAGHGTGELCPSGCEVPESPAVLRRSAGLGARCLLLPAIEELLVLAGTAGCFSRSRSSC